MADISSSMGTAEEGKVAPAAAATTSQHPIPLPSSIPKVLTRSFLVLNVPTDAWVQIFVDRIFFGVSQLEGGKVGTYLLCEAETSQTNLRQTEYHVSTLLGNRDDAMLGVYARTLLERIRAFHDDGTSSAAGAGAGAKPNVLLLGISLDKETGQDPKMFRLVVDIMVDLYIDAVRET